MIDGHAGLSMAKAPLILLCLTLGMLPLERLWAITWSINGGSLRATVIEALAFATIGAWLLTALPRGRQSLPPRSVLVALASLALVSLTAALLAHPDARSGAVQWVARLVLALGLFLVASDVGRDPWSVRVALLAFLVAATGSAIVGVALLVEGTPDGSFGVWRFLTIGGTPRTDGTWGHPNIAGGAWSVALLVGLPLLLDRSRSSTRVAITCCLGLVGAALVLSYSRGALLGTLAGLAVLGVLGLRGTVGRLARLAPAAAVLLAAGLLVAYPLGSAQLARLADDSDSALYGADYAVLGQIGIDPGATREVQVVATNRGEMTWQPRGSQEVRLVGYWFEPGPRGPLEVVAATAGLRAPVGPGETAELVATVLAPDRPGRYRIAWDLEQVGIQGFSERGVRTALTDVTVADGAGRAPQDPALAATIDPYPARSVDVSRVDRWRAGLAIVAEHPVLGIGPGVFRLVFGRYLGLERSNPRGHSHDLYLELAVGTGLTGLAAFLAALIVTVRPQIQCLWRRVDGVVTAPEHLRAGLLAAVLSMLVHGFVDYLLHATAILVLFWAVVGLGLGLAPGITASSWTYRRSTR